MLRLAVLLGVALARAPGAGLLARAPGLLALTMPGAGYAPRAHAPRAPTPRTPFRMPRLDGLAFTRKLLQSHPDAVVVVMSTLRLTPACPDRHSGLADYTRLRRRSKN